MAARRSSPRRSEPFWIGRPVELPGSRPLRFEFDQDIGGRLAEWPVTHTVKCLAFYPPRRRRGAEGRADRDAPHALTRRRGGTASNFSSRSSPASTAPSTTTTTATVLEALYAAGIKPDWWKLEPQATPAAWRQHRGASSRKADPWCRGVVLLGLEAPERRTRGGLRPLRRRRRRQGFRRRPHDLQRRRREMARRRDRRRGGDRRHGGPLRPAHRAPGSEHGARGRLEPPPSMVRLSR